MGKRSLRVVEVRAGGMWRKVAVAENDAQIRGKVDGLYLAVADGCRRSGRLLDVWLAIERELCPRGLVEV